MDISVGSCWQALFSLFAVGSSSLHFNRDFLQIPLAGKRASRRIAFLFLVRPHEDQNNLLRHSTCDATVMDPRKMMLYDACTPCSLELFSLFETSRQNDCDSHRSSSALRDFRRLMLFIGTQGSSGRRKGVTILPRSTHWRDRHCGLVPDGFLPFSEQGAVHRPSLEA
ncbi:hypothetical protein DFH11DRAFT_700471 [Phellopilus nigrolimitatus]|nr:hypothetical protein DFH11DRAFT_700471 [Phellopilus nigrolimitatus]